ncbi:MAG: hypothetical protein EHM41_00290 [Chloroflexi bacterium]|nr:MAG: hypothetical protein EHM41_00290 [Chloroflexota bacterium]
MAEAGSKIGFQMFKDLFGKYVNTLPAKNRAAIMEEAKEADVMSPLLTMENVTKHSISIILTENDDRAILVQKRIDPADNSSVYVIDIVCRSDRTKLQTTEEIRTMLILSPRSNEYEEIGPEEIYRKVIEED